MFFDKKKYKEIIDITKILYNIVFVIIILLCMAIGYIISKSMQIDLKLCIAISIMIGLVIGLLSDINKQRKLEEMKMKLDIYIKIMEEKNKQ